MIRAISALTAIALLGSAGAMADDRHDERNSAAQRYSACTLAAARKLAMKAGTPGPCCCCGPLVRGRGRRPR
jgi:hypothetical protein